MIKKLMIIMGLMLIMISSVSAEVFVPIRFVDENTNTFPGITDVQVYYRYSEENIELWKEHRTNAEDQGVTVSLHTRMPSGMQDYLVFFFREEYLPYVAVTDYAGSGHAPEFPVPFIKKKDAIAEIRDFNVESVNEGEPVVFTIEATADGEVFSPFKINNEITSFIPKDYEHYYKTEVEIKLEVYNKADNSLEYEIVEVKNIFAGASERFEFIIAENTLSEGEYGARATSRITDKKVEQSTALSSTNTVEFEVYSSLDKVCNVNLGGINLYPVMPKSTGQEIMVYGTKISNQFISSNLNANPMPAELTLNVREGNNNVVYTETKMIPAGTDTTTAVNWNFRIAPDTLTTGRYTIEVVGKATCGAEYENEVRTYSVTNINLEETITIPNNAPVFKHIPTQIIEIGESFTLNLEDYAIDYENDVLTFNYDVEDETRLRCTLVGAHLSCTGEQEPGTRVRVYASDHQYTATTTFEVRVGEEKTENRAPKIVSRPIRTASKNVEYVYEAEAVDPDGDVIRWELRKGPYGMKIDEKTGVVTWMPDIRGEFEVSIRAIDPHGARDTQTYRLEVRIPLKDTNRPESTLVETTRVTGNEYLRAGETLRMLVGYENTNGYDFKGLTITASVAELGIVRRLGPYKLDNKETLYRELHLEIPDYAEEGVYTVKVVYNDDRFRKIDYREFVVRE